MINESLVANSNTVRFFLGKVESVDENYIITFSIPELLDNLQAYPTAYPHCSDHVKEVKIGDSVLIEKLELANQFFTYIPMNKNSETGLYFGKVRVDITDGETVNIDTDNVKITLDGKNNSIFIGDSNYSLNKFFEDFGKALSALHTEGSQNNHTATTWYNTQVQPLIVKLSQLFKTNIDGGV